MNNETRKIESVTIEKKITKQDKNNDEYLILNLNNGESIFCFSDPEINLDELSENGKYDFTVREGRNGANILVSFARIAN